MTVLFNCVKDIGIIVATGVPALITTFLFANFALSANGSGLSKKDVLISELDL